MIRYTAAAAVALMLGASPLHAQSVAVFTITAAKADVHADPSTGSRVVGTTEKGTTFEVTRELGSWVRVNWPAMPNGGGYLHTSWGTLAHGTVTSPGSTKTVEPSASSSPTRVSASAAAPSPLPSRAPVALSSTTPVDLSTGRASQTGLAAPRPSAPVVVPTHIVGIGGRMAATENAFAASGRLWASDAFGVQLELGRSMTGAATFGGRVRTTTIGSSAVFSTPDLVSDAMLVRPYVGAGASLYRGTLSLTPGVATSADRGFGYQLFGGGEFTWAGIPHLAVSAELRREWAPTLFPGFDTSGLGLGLSAHWYVK